MNAWIERYKRLNLKPQQLAFYGLTAWTVLAIILLAVFNRFFTLQTSVVIILVHLVVLVMFIFFAETQSVSTSDVDVFYVIGDQTVKEKLSSGSSLRKVPALNNQYEGFYLSGRLVQDMTSQQPKASCVYIAKARSTSAEVKPVAVAPAVEVEATVQTMALEPLTLKNVSQRPRYVSHAEVERGTYIECNQKNEYVNRYVNIDQNHLPALLEPTNYYIKVDKQELSQLSLKALDVKAYIKKTPGSYVEPGYYFEVDTVNQPLDSVVHTEKRLPPTGAKGHRWVQIQPRRITS